MLHESVYQSLIRRKHFPLIPCLKMLDRRTGYSIESIPRIAHAQQKINHAYLCQWRLRGNQRLCQVWKVVIETVKQCLKDHAHRNSGSICDKITSHRRPSDLLGQFTEEEKKMKKFRNFFHSTIGGTFKML